MSDRIVFVDVEATGLDPDRHEPWEIALLTPAGLDDQHAGLTQTWQVHADLATAEALGVKVPDDTHTAAVDVRLAYDVYVAAQARRGESR